MATVEKELFTFPEPAAADAVEWPGTPIGAPNVLTRTKSRTATHDKTIDAKPGRYEELLGSATRYMESAEGKLHTQIHDVVVHGIRVRAHTNSDHLIDFWVNNWFDPEEWRAATGRSAPDEPQVMVYAFGGIAGQPEAAYFSRKHDTVIFFNTSYYGQLKSWVLGAVGRVLADEYGIHSLHGAAVELSGKKGVLYIAPTGTGKSTSSYGLMKFPNTRFHSDDWVYVRYVYQTKDGRRVGPRRIEAPEGPVLGYRCFRWLEEHPGVDAPLVGLTPDNEEIQLRTTDLALDKGIEAYTYISEKVFYLRTNLVENFPEAGLDILNSKKENVPDITPDFLEAHRALLDNVTQLVMNADHAPTREHFQGLGAEKTREIMGRLFAFDNARAMLDVTPVFGKERVFTNPLEPLFVTSVFLLKRDFTDPVIIERLPLERFMERLLIGITPYGTREIAYNNYRATDDVTERKFIADAEQEANATSTPLYPLLLSKPGVPETLLEEFELFRVMYQAAACYDLNTVLQNDPQVQSKMEAVRLTMDVIATAVEKRPEHLRLTIDDYRSFIGG
ncbi:MAG: hypothetical protein IT305_17045 [Chloroflexi bacterium]|nr:hypothetical protein [Chloroflexota bacterium]